MLTSQGDQQQIYLPDQDAGGSPPDALGAVALSVGRRHGVADQSMRGRLYSTDSTNDAVDLVTGPLGNQPLVVATPSGTNSAPATCPAPPTYPANYLATVNPWTGGSAHSPFKEPPTYLREGSCLFLATSASAAIKTVLLINPESEEASPQPGDRGEAVGAEPGHKAAGVGLSVTVTPTGLPRNLVSIMGTCPATPSRWPDARSTGWASARCSFPGPASSDRRTTATAPSPCCDGPWTAGVDHIDTAQFYGPDVANELIHEALCPYPTELVLVSKVGARRDDRGSGCRRSAGRAACRGRSQSARSRSGTDPGGQPAASSPTPTWDSRAARRDDRAPRRGTDRRNRTQHRDAR